MNYSEEEIERVRAMASVFVSITDIATVLEIAPEVLRGDIADKGSAISKAYYSGKAESKLKIYSQEMKLAQIGSPLALENTRRFLMDMEDDE